MASERCRWRRCALCLRGSRRGCRVVAAPLALPRRPRRGATATRCLLAQGDRGEARGVTRDAHGPRPYSSARVLAGLVAALWLYPWLDSRRYQRLTASPATEFFVTSSAEQRPWQLARSPIQRDPLGSADGDRVAANEIFVSTPLPPSVGRRAIRIRSDGEPRTIRAAPSLETPVFDVRAGRLELEDIVIRGASAAYAVITVSPERVTLRRVTIADSDVGVRAAGSFELEIDGSTFDGNRVGVEALGAGTSRHGPTFRGTKRPRSGRSAPRRSRSTRARSRRPATASKAGGSASCSATCARCCATTTSAAFAATGSWRSAGPLEITGNRIWDGARCRDPLGRMRGGLVQGNDVHEIGAMGILVQAGAAAKVSDNRVYRNGYGIVTVFNDDPAAVELRNNLVLSQLVDGIVDLRRLAARRREPSIQNRSAGIRALQRRDGELLSSGVAAADRQRARARTATTSPSSPSTCSSGVANERATRRSTWLPRRSGATGRRCSARRSSRRSRRGTSASSTSTCGRRCARC